VKLATLFPPSRLDDTSRFQRPNRFSHGLNTAAGSSGDLLMRWKAGPASHVEGSEQELAQHLDAGAF